MTCIVGLTDGSAVCMGGDSASVAGWDLNLDAGGKVFVNGPFIMGFTTSFRMGQLLRFALKPPAHPKGMMTDAYMATVFVDAVRDCLKAGGYATRDKEVETAGTFLVGYRGRLFRVAPDYCIVEPPSGFDACGCGQMIALGSLHETAGTPPKERVRRALTAAERFSAGVRGPMTVLSWSPVEWLAGAELPGISPQPPNATSAKGDAA